MPMSSGGYAASSSGCATRPKAREIGSSEYAGPTQHSLPIGYYVTATAEHREPCDSRGSCTVLGVPGGEIPPGDSTVIRPFRRGSQAASAGAVEGKRERSAVRSYPAGGRGGEMSRDNHDGAIGEALEQAPPCRSCSFRFDAEATVELRLRALQCGMHDVAAQDHGCLLRPDHHAYVAWRVSRPRLDPYAIVKSIIRGDQLNLAAL